MSRLDQLAHDPEKEDRIMRGLLEAQLEIVRFGMYRPGCSKEFRLEIVRSGMYPPGCSKEFRKELDRDKEPEERSV